MKTLCDQHVVRIPILTLERWRRKAIVKARTSSGEERDRLSILVHRIQREIREHPGATRIEFTAPLKWFHWASTNFGTPADVWEIRGQLSSGD
jgi:hypothetical protein